jgi:hypothetical protein
MYRTGAALKQVATAARVAACARLSSATLPQEIRMRLVPSARVPGPIAAALLAAMVSMPAASATLSFAGYTWTVRDDVGGPGPNTWSASNAWVDAAGLHLRIANTNGQWSCAEVVMAGNLGFGHYQFQVDGRPDLFDRNVVLGLFNYPPPKVGPDGTNEIDIEFAQWGDAGNPNRLNWTVYPPALGPKSTHAEFPMSLNGTATTHRFTWSATGVDYLSLNGWQDGTSNFPIASWNDRPGKPRQRIPQHTLPVHMNLWLFQGHAPTDGQPVEIVIRSFKYTAP